MELDGDQVGMRLVSTISRRPLRQGGNEKKGQGSM